jgi:hypothetical protein
LLSDIVKSFDNKISCGDSLVNGKIGSSDPDKMPLADIIHNWFNHPDLDSNAPPDSDFVATDTEVPSDAVIDHFTRPDSNEEEDLNMPELLAYRDFIFQAPAYHWLLASVRRELVLAPAERKSMEAIRDKILVSLPTSHKVSKHRSAEAYKATFEIEWDPLAFITEQGYVEEPAEALERAITLTGSTKHAQALTCAQYLLQTWPTTGRHIVRLVKGVVRHEPGHRQVCKY